MWCDLFVGWWLVVCLFVYLLVWCDCYACCACVDVLFGCLSVCVVCVFVLLVGWLLFARLFVGWGVCCMYWLLVLRVGCRFVSYVCCSYVDRLVG